MLQEYIFGNVESVEVHKMSEVVRALNGIKVRVFFRKSIEEKHLCPHIKNYYYFCKSNIPVINLTVGSTAILKIFETNSSFHVK